eukprot:scaffold132468_cov19-Tisochrysis_lutea.AAC.1
MRGGCARTEGRREVGRCWGSWLTGLHPPTLMLVAGDRRQVGAGLPTLQWCARAEHLPGALRYWWQETGGICPPNSPVWMRLVCSPDAAALHLLMQLSPDAAALPDVAATLLVH